MKNKINIKEILTIGIMIIAGSFIGYVLALGIQTLLGI